MSDCEKCSRNIVENDNNPNAHYATKEKICSYCKAQERVKAGDYIQMPNGDYAKSEEIK